MLRYELFLSLIKYNDINYPVGDWGNFCLTFQFPIGRLN